MNRYEFLSTYDKIFLNTSNFSGHNFCRKHFWDFSAVLFLFTKDLAFYVRFSMALFIGFVFLYSFLCSLFNEIRFYKSNFYKPFLPEVFLQLFLCRAIFACLDIFELKIFHSPECGFWSHRLFICRHFFRRFLNRWGSGFFVHRSFWSGFFRKINFYFTFCAGKVFVLKFFLPYFL